jgi:hypothetical protein
VALAVTVRDRPLPIMPPDARSWTIFPSVRVILWFDILTRAIQ